MKIVRFIIVSIFMLPLLFVAVLFVDSCFVNGQWPFKPLSTTSKTINLSDGGKVIIEETEDRDFSARGTNNKISYIPPTSSEPEEIVKWHGHQRIDASASVYEGNTVVIPLTGYSGINQLHIRTNEKKWNIIYFYFGFKEKNKRIAAANKIGMDIKDYEKIYSVVANQIPMPGENLSIKTLSGKTLLSERLTGEIASFDSHSGIVKLEVGVFPKILVYLQLSKDGQALKLVSIKPL